MTQSTGSPGLWDPLPPGHPITRDRVAAIKAALASILGEVCTEASRVAIALQDQAQFLATVHAVHDAGAVAVLLSSLLSGDKNGEELRRRAGRSEPDVVVVDGAHRGILGDLVEPGVGVLAIEADGPRWLRRPRATDRRQNWAGSALMVFTSGSTSLPKGVVLSRDCFSFLLRTHAHVLGWEKEDTYLAALPLTHVLGLVNLHASLLAGGRAVVSPSFMWPERVVQACLESRVTVMGLVPYYLSRLLNVRGFDALTGVRQTVVSSASVVGADMEQLKGRLPELDVLHTYGLTEAFRSTVLGSGDVPGRLPSIGKTVPGVEIQLRTAEGGLVNAPDGQGVAWIRGPNVMQGYWGDTALTASVLEDGWFCASDIMERSADGYLTLVGRTSEMLNGGGEKLMAHHLEAVIAQALPVAEVMVCAAHCLDGIDQVVAVVVPEAGQTIDPADVRRACARAVHSVFVPREIVLLARLPRRENGKVDRAEVIRIARGKLSASAAPALRLQGDSR